MATVAMRGPLVPRPLRIVLLVAVLLIAYLGLAAAVQDEDGPWLAQGSAVSAAGSPAAELGPRRADPGTTDRSGRADPAVGPAVFADVDGLPLTLPHDEVLAVAYHEASRPEAIAMTPHGRLVANDNPSRFTPGADTVGPDYRVLSSRGRPRAPTSAVDIVVPGTATVTAPVTGTVVEVRRYVLYGSLEDWRVVIEPAARPDLHVVMIHLHEPRVRVSDRVEAGQTSLAVARALPFSSHVDYVLGEPSPHVHLEVKAATKPAPLDPHAPAVEPTEVLD